MAEKKRMSVVCFANGRNILFNGWMDGERIKRIENLKATKDFGAVINYINDHPGESISCAVHGKFHYTLKKFSNW